MHESFGNLYPGLAEGSIDNESSYVINSTVGDSLLLIGDVVQLIPFFSPIFGTQPEDLLPRIAIPFPDGSNAYGVIVGGNKKGAYNDGTIPFSLNNAIATGVLAGTFGDSVKVCTHGRCIARIHNVTGSELPVGTPLTAAFSGPFGVFGNFRIASSGDFVSARLLQTVPFGDEDAPVFRMAAVDIQREGRT